ncbi:uncharacterized protein LOC115229563 [Octopus sinensis]|uniref:Uncharacterized protein LOC115229563 n=1 Tax=Octopus sinensis TaxID=2607531 RepID=A0A6P7U4B7_9MOLL|nr:uncharacterized protein LOC115229563 [Octopus sinensis]
MLSRKRKANFTKQELEVLVANVQARKDILFTKRNTPVSNQAKQHAWECIARKVNSVESVMGEHRTVNDVRRKWVCLLSETKKAEMQRRRRNQGADGASGSSLGLSGALALGIGSGEYTPLLAEAILNISKSIGASASDGKTGSCSYSVDRNSSLHNSLEEVNELSLSAGDNNFIAGVAQVSHGLSNSSNQLISNTSVNDTAGNNTSYLQVSSVYSQSDILDDVEDQLNNSPSRNTQSPTMINKANANIVSNLKATGRSNVNQHNSGAHLTPDVTANTIYSVTNINNRENITAVNSDLGIVQITPNISSSVYGNNSVYLDETGDSKITLPDGSIVSVRKRRHSQQSNNDLNRTNFNPEEIISDQDDDIQDIEIDPKQIDLNSAPVYSVSTYTNSSDSEQRDKSSYQVTALDSIAGSDTGNRLRTKRKRLHQISEHYSEKLYRVEKQRLLIEERRLAVEEERLSIEKELLALKKQRFNEERQQASHIQNSALGMSASHTSTATIPSTLVDSSMLEENISIHSRERTGSDKDKNYLDELLVKEANLKKLVSNHSEEISKSDFGGGRYDIFGLEDSEIYTDFEDSVGISY